MRLMFSILTTLVFCSTQVMAAPCVGGCHEMNQPHKAEAQSTQTANHDCCDESLNQDKNQEKESPCHSEGSACLSQCSFEAKVEGQIFTIQSESGKKFSDGHLISTSTQKQFSLDVAQSQLIAWVDQDHRTSGVPFYIFYQKLLIP